MYRFHYQPDSQVKWSVSVQGLAPPLCNFVEYNALLFYYVSVCLGQGYEVHSASDF